MSASADAPGAPVAPSAPAHADGYVYPGTRVLRNKADLRDAEQLSRFERGVTAVRIQELREKPIQGQYDLAHLQAIHHQVFRDVYDWAGHVRTVDIARGPATDRTVFAFKEDIGVKAALIKASIEDANHLRGLDRRQFASKAGEVYAAVNELHPFREGNGRATREYMSQLAQESGHRLDYTLVGKERWNEAAKLSSRGDLLPIREVLYEITTVERAIAFDTLSQHDALARHPELDAAFKALYEAQRSNLDVDSLRANISGDLHQGKAVTADVSIEESRRVIDHAAAYRGLIVRSADRLGGAFKGEVVSVSSHHAMLKVGDMIAVRYERANLERSLQPGERVSIDYGNEGSSVYARSDAPQRDRGRDSMQIEREQRLATS